MQKTDLWSGHVDTEQSRTTWGQVSESEALGTEEAETERAEASFKSAGGRKERRLSFQGNSRQRTDL